MGNELTLEQVKESLEILLAMLFQLNRTKAIKKAISDVETELKYTIGSNLDLCLKKALKHVVEEKKIAIESLNITRKEAQIFTMTDAIIEKTPEAMQYEYIMLAASINAIILKDTIRFYNGETKLYQVHI